MSEHDSDILLWSEHQAELLRRHAVGVQANDTTIDWTNIIEEIESIGNEQLHVVTSNLMQALIHTLKALKWPLSPEVPHWEAEARVSRANAAGGFVPSMRRRIDMARIYRRALRGLPETIGVVEFYRWDETVSQPTSAVPDICPVTLDELLSED